MVDFYSRLFAKTPRFDFVGKRVAAFIITAVIIFGSIAAIAVKGFNFGIDFAGGILLEVQTTSGPAELALMRSTLNNLDLGEVSLQEFGDQGRDVMIRIQRQSGDDQAQMTALNRVKESLGEGYEYRRVEIVGPKVGGELVRDGILAISLAVLAIAAYVWFRFEWQFGVGALLSTFHDVIAVFGFYSVTGMEFNLTSVAAILTVAGYSINDTVVIYDRVRENLRKYKNMPLFELLNLSANETLTRTFLTVWTVFVAVLALYLFGGEILKGFSAAMLWGLVVGTYSSVFVSLPVLFYFNLRANEVQVEDKAP